jgi:epidermal growth factor receptor substrate 15
VLRLIGHYQAGQDPTRELAFRPGPLPKFDGGVGGGPAIPPPPTGPPPGAIQPQSSGGPIRVPPLTPEKVNQYAALFEKSGAQNGILPGEQAKQIFERAGLPNEILGRIWNLADTEQRGALVVTEFIIAMHLLASFKSGTLRALPSILPAGLYEAAARRAPVRQMSGTMSATAPLSTIARPFNGAIAGRVGSPLGRSSFVPPPQVPQASSQNNDWAVSSMDKAQFDTIYADLDKNNRGFITGDEAVPFFSNSKLPEEVLAQIWDLADINSLGRLTRDEFAVAMFLIRQQRSKRDGRDSLPTSLPPNLVPPSMRNQIRPSVQSPPPAFDPSAQPVSKSAAEDLFGLDALSASPPAQPQVPTSTGGSAGFADPFSSSRTPLTSSSPAQGTSPGQSTSFKPFVPSSSFGRTLTYDVTGGSKSSASAQQSRSSPSALDDLLGDNDPEISNKLTTETSELANLSNQIGTLSKQMQEVQGQRSTAQNELNQATAQKREFELRLSQLRSLYEQEVKDVRGLQERLTASRNETKKLQQEIARIDGTHQDLQNQHRQIATALQADQQENTLLKERIKALNGEIAQMKPQVEKLRLEARQIKGLVAINKKQLATTEIERDKLKTEVEELTKSNEEQSRAITASSQVQSPPPITSPTLSTMSANNPFFRRQPSVSSDIGSSPFTQSPAPPPQSDRSFDNVFGPSFVTASTTGETSMPQTSFKQEIEARHSPPVTMGKSPSRRSADGSENNASSVAQNESSREEASETPAPPKRQVSSTFMPFQPEHSNTFGSSRQVSAPNSRFGESSTTTGTDTPTSHNGATPTGLPSSSQTEALQGLSSPFDWNRTASPATSEARSVTNVKDSMPGAFPGDGNPHLISTPTGGSSLSEQAVSGASGTSALNKEQPRVPNAAKNDFDAAFAGFGASSASNERQATTHSAADDPTTAAGIFNKEFPPLRELEADDESDSGSEQGGFEDDFTSASPSHSRKESSAHSQFSQPQGTSATGTGTLFPPLSPTSNSASAASLGPNPSSSNAQSPPQVYDKTIPPHEKPRSEVEQYSGLLPTRENNTPSSQQVDHPFNGPLATGGQALLGNSSSSNLAKPPQPAKTSFDDFDHDFDDLEDAKEADLDDDFANISVLDRSGIVDFDPTFDSPAASKTSQHTAQGSTGFGNDSNGFGDFTQSPISPLKPQLAQSGGTSSKHDSHDWDAIFAGLDASSNNSNNSAGVSKLPATDTGGASTAKGNGTAAQPVRPQAGRALTEAGVHDDPILKELTAMGYARKDALSALEKYDYNLERVRAPATARRIGSP